MDSEQARKKITDQIRSLEESLDEIDKGIYEVRPGEAVSFRQGYPPHFINAHMNSITRITFSQTSIEFWDGTCAFSLNIKPLDEELTPLTIFVVGYTP